MSKTKKKLFVGIDTFLKETFGDNLTQEKLAKIINEQQPRYSNCLKDDNYLCSSALHKYMQAIYERGKKDGIIEGRQQNAENLFKAIESIHGFETDTLIAEKLILGKSQNAKTTSLSKYRNGVTAISDKQYRNILGKHSSKIFKPLIEFLECNPHKRGSSWKLFRGDDKRENFIKTSLSDEKGAKVGVYAMYDSAGRIIYFGKTTNGLYQEIIQRLDAVVHRDVVLSTKDGLKHVGGTKGSIRVGSMTKYISAVEVLAPEAIKNIEAFVLRLIPNDDVNYKIENYD